jgi:hypothetical protein
MEVGVTDRTDQDGSGRISTKKGSSGNFGKPQNIFTAKNAKNAKARAEDYSIQFILFFAPAACGCALYSETKAARKILMFNPSRMPSRSSRSSR